MFHNGKELGTIPRDGQNANGGSCPQGLADLHLRLALWLGWGEAVESAAPRRDATRTTTLASL